MGQVVNLCQMLGVPEQAMCLSCGRTFATSFDAYDIDQKGTNPGPGQWALIAECTHCGVRMRMRVVVNPRERGKLDAYFGEVMANWLQIPSEKRRRFLAHIREHVAPEGPVAADALERLSGHAPTQKPAREDARDKGGPDAQLTGDQRDRE